MNWEELMIQGGYGGLPDDYLVFDLETTGSKRGEDLPIDCGWCIVKDRKPVDMGNFMLNWAGRDDLVDPEWLRWKLLAMDTVFRNRNDQWVYTYELLSQEGLDPIWVLHFYYDLLKSNNEAGKMTVGQNVRVFDKQMLAATFAEYLNCDWPIPMDNILDTGCLEKAVASRVHLDPQFHLVPLRGEKLDAFFKRVYGRRLPMIKWSVNHCIDKYDIPGIDKSRLHGAQYDCYAVHLILEANRCETKPQPRIPVGQNA